MRVTYVKAWHSNIVNKTSVVAPRTQQLHPKVNTFYGYYQLLLWYDSYSLLCTSKIREYNQLIF